MHAHTHTHTHTPSHTCTHMHSRTHTHTHTHMHTHALTLTHAHTHTHAHINTQHTHINTHAHTCARMHSYMHAHTLTYTRAHTHALTHMYSHTHMGILQDKAGMSTFTDGRSPRGASVGTGGGPGREPDGSGSRRPPSPPRKSLWSAGPATQAALEEGCCGEIGVAGGPSRLGSPNERRGPRPALCHGETLPVSHLRTEEHLGASADFMV